MKSLTMKILSQEAQIKTSPQGLSHNMLSILPRFSSGDLPSHPGISPAISFSIRSILVFIRCFISLSNQLKIKQRIRYATKTTKPSPTSPALSLSALSLSFEHNKTKSPFVSPSLPTALQLNPCEETPHPLVKPIKPSNPDTIRIQHPSVSLLFILISSCFSRFCTLTDRLLRHVQTPMISDDDGLDWTQMDTCGFTWIHSDSVCSGRTRMAQSGHDDIILSTTHRRLPTLLIRHCLLELCQLPHHSHQVPFHAAYPADGVVHPQLERRHKHPLLRPAESFRGTRHARLAFPLWFAGAWLVFLVVADLNGLAGQHLLAQLWLQASYWLVSVCPRGSETHLPGAFPFSLFSLPPLPPRLLDFSHLAFAFRHGPHMRLGSPVHCLKKLAHRSHGTLCSGLSSSSVTSLSSSSSSCMTRCQSGQYLPPWYQAAYLPLDGDDNLHAVHRAVHRWGGHRRGPHHLELEPLGGCWFRGWFHRRRRLPALLLLLMHWHCLFLGWIDDLDPFFIFRLRCLFRLVRRSFLLCLSCRVVLAHLALGLPLLAHRLGLLE